MVRLLGRSDLHMQVRVSTGLTIFLDHVGGLEPSSPGADPGFF